MASPIQKFPSIKGGGGKENSFQKLIRSKNKSKQNKHERQKKWKNKKLRLLQQL